MDLSFPKYIEIKNGRLQLVYHALKISTLVALFSIFYIYDGYLLGTSMAGHVHVTVWPNLGNSAESITRAVEVFLEMSKKPLCKQPQHFDFWYSTDFRYVNHSCVFLCLDETQDECISPMDLALQEGTDQLFLTTQYDKTFVPKYLDAFPQKRSYLVPLTEVITVGFNYHFNLPNSKVAGGFPWMSRSFSGSSEKDALTIVLDHKDQPIDVIRPGGRTDMTVARLLELAGKPDLLDEFGTLPNELQGAKNDVGPLTRIGGAEISLEIECFNSKPNAFAMKLLPDDWEGEKTCYMRVRHEEQANFISVARREPAEDADGRQGENSIVSHGIRVTAKGDGIFKVWDPYSIYLNLVSIWVVSSMPKSFVLFVALWLLGHLSKIYRRAINEKFHIEEEVGGMATRLMANSVNFGDLKEKGDTTTNNSDRGGISKRKMGERLKYTLEHRGEELDEIEVEAFVNFCFSAVTTDREQEKQLMKREISCMGRSLTSLFGGRETREEVEPADKINIDMFSKACSTNDKIKFESVVELFDRERKTGILETFFMPMAMRKYLSEVDHRRRTSKSDGDKSTFADHKREKSSDTIKGLGFESSRVTFCDLESGDCHSPSRGQPQVMRNPSTDSGKLTLILAKHVQKLKKMVQDDSSLENMSPEQRRELLPLMCRVLQDVLARELAIYPKLQNCESRLEDFSSELEGQAIGSKMEDFGTKLEHFESKLEESARSMGSMQESLQDQSTTEHQRLSKELETTKATLSKCMKELAKREGDIAEFKRLEDTIAELKSMSASPANAKADGAKAHAKQSQNLSRDAGPMSWGCGSRGKAR